MLKAKQTKNIISIIDAVPPRTYRKPNSFHASGLLDCQRKQVLGLLGVVEPERVSKPEWGRAADMGNALHDMITDTLKARGVLEQAEITLPANEFNVGGRVDAVIIRDGTRRVAELKSKHQKGFAAFAPGDHSFEQAYAQIQFYLFALHLERGYIICISRDTLILKEYQVEYDDNYMLGIIARLRRLNEMLINKTIPSPERGSCLFCGFENTEHCKTEDNWLNEGERE